MISVTMAVHAESYKQPFATPRARFLAGRMGMWLFLLSLGMLFAASVIGYLVVRLTSDVWPENLPDLPGMLWVSTGIILCSSLTMQGALESIRSAKGDWLNRAMAMTFALGLGFLVVQAFCWSGWLTQIQSHWGESAEYRFALTSFYVLTGVHAAHVIGGLIPMGVVLKRSLAHRYTNSHHSGVYYVTMYWHFLGGVWIVLYTTLLLGT